MTSYSNYYDLNTAAKFPPEPNKIQSVQGASNDIDPLTAFSETMERAGLILSGSPVATGGFIRVPTQEDRGDKKTGWYVLYDNGNFMAGAYGDFRTGDNGTLWSSIDRQAMTAAQLAKYQHQQQLVRKQREAEQANIWAEAAKGAKQIWSSGQVADSHPYLKRKQVTATACISTTQRQYAGWLMVPAYDKGGDISTIQFIHDDGTKKFLKGGRKKGCYHVIEGNSDKIYIAEGYATGLTLSAATGKTCVVAWDSGNLMAVAKTIKAEYPNSVLIVAGDNDHENIKSNVGYEKATAVASALGIRAVFPVCKAGESDFNDIHVNQGLKEVIKQLDVVASHGVKITNANDIKMEPINWIWEGWLAGGKLQLLAGQAGTGKTTIALGLAAIISVGGRWPDNTHADPGGVLIWSGEDDPADSLLPRLTASDADLNNIYFVDGHINDYEKRNFDPATDIPDLVDKVRDIKNLKLIIIDPIVSAVSGDSHKNTEVRRSLQPIVDMAGNVGVAILGITHFTKGTKGTDPLERVIGSQAFGAIARVVLSTIKSQEVGKSSRLVRTKSNIGPDGGGFEYDLTRHEVGEGIEGQAILWGNPLEGSAETLFSVLESGDDNKTAVDEATLWLEELLSDGDLPSKEIKSIASDSGFSWRTIQRAQSASKRIEIIRSGFGKETKVTWSLSKQGHQSRQGYYD